MAESSSRNDFSTPVCLRQDESRASPGYEAGGRRKKTAWGEIAGYNIPCKWIQTRWLARANPSRRALLFHPLSRGWGFIRRAALSRTPCSTLARKEKPHEAKHIHMQWTSINKCQVKHRTSLRWPIRRALLFLRGGYPGTQYRKILQ